MENKYDIVIAYRIYPRVSKVPPVFSDDKYKLSELCLYSLRQSLGNLKIKLFALLDGCPETYSDLFRKYFNEDELEIFRYDSIGNAGTFKEQVRLLLNQDYSENIYFAEDDYFYLKDAFPKMLGFLSDNQDVDFISPYYHPDYDRMEVHSKFPSEEKVFGNETWKTYASTTLTFMTTKKILNHTKNIFLTYTKKNYDVSIWFCLTKHLLNNPFNSLIYGFKNHRWFKIFIKSWLYTKKQILTGEKYNLFVLKKTLSTHMDSKCLAPDVDWNNKFKETIEKIFN